jgi:aspartyl-tRNA(Asn)/glutamyl-tRNA(Gln) amidotransferase subunit B
VSIRPKGSDCFGNRAEIKNMSSFRFMMDAIEYEINRQEGILESGGEVEQETRLFDEQKKITLPMRSKEDAPDYRYFPDPDLLEVEIDKEFVSRIRESMPDLPDQQLNNIMEEFGIPRNDAVILTKDREVSEYFRACAAVCEDSRRLSNWIIKELFKLLKDASISIQECVIRPEDFSELIHLISRGEITETIARTVLEEMFRTGTNPGSIIKEKGLKTISDDSLLGSLVEETMAENPEAVAQIRAGEQKPVDFLVGQVMKKTRGKADPKKARELIQKKMT